MIFINDDNSFEGNFCNLENCIWTTGLPDCSGDKTPPLLSGDGVLWNRKCHQFAETAHCASGMATID